LEAHQGALRSGKHLRGLLVDLGARTRFQATVELDGARISEGSLRLGRYGDGASALDLDRTPWWLFTYFIVHLGLVALPEEWFFRGYLQGRLDRLWGTRFTLFGVRFGWGLVAASAAFAALHPILIPGFHRLLVFFPGLFFGWLRAKTGNIGAAVLVHALSNLLLAIISQMYGVV
jgi:membrane protease YdiL (CAAX protease family)